MPRKVTQEEIKRREKALEDWFNNHGYELENPYWTIELFKRFHEDEPDIPCYLFKAAIVKYLKLNKLDRPRRTEPRATKYYVSITTKNE
jgi:hypothetical protein